VLNIFEIIRPLKCASIGINIAFSRFSSNLRFKQSHDSLGRIYIKTVPCTRVFYTFYFLPFNAQLFYTRFFFILTSENVICNAVTKNGPVESGHSVWGDKSNIIRIWSLTYTIHNFHHLRLSNTQILPHASDFDLKDPTRTHYWLHYR